MRLLSRILTICLCLAPMVDFAAHAAVATTSGHNLTAYNPSNSNNNQWASLTNVRTNNTAQTTARADFGNCNALIMRCATPKCANGGCVDSNVAAAIVAGCVQSNDVCAQYGNELISYMTAQLVANSTAKVNAQRAAADAAAAQSANAEQTAQQIAQMQSSMQQQMAQMQQQMAQQNEAAQQRLQEALAAQAEQNAAALQNVSAVAVSATPTIAAVQTAQEAAIERGISSDILVRQQITGRIMTEIENAETSLKETKTAMQNSFEYAGCDSRGNNCTGPKRVKKWRELATEFLDPYDNTINKIYDALVTAESVGVDLTQIYAMLDDSCTAWAQYMCPGVGSGWYIEYGYYKDDKYVSSTPHVCKGALEGEPNRRRDNEISESEWNQCRSCTWVKNLSESDDIYIGWTEPEDFEAKTNQRVVACAGGALKTAKIFRRRSRSINGAGVVDIDQLDTWLHQTEPSGYEENDVAEAIKWCNTDDMESKLKSSISSRKVPAQNADFCVEHDGSGFSMKEEKVSESSDDYCPYISNVYAICDTHPYNIGKKEIGKNNNENRDKMREMIALKVTVISQQMYKQYEYLNATLRRLKTQLEKSVLTTTLEAAGAKSDGSSSSGGLLGSSRDSDKEIVLAGAENCWNSNSRDDKYKCLQNNLNLIKSNAATNRQMAKKQLEKSVSLSESLGIKGIKCSVYEKDNETCKTKAPCYSYSSKDEILKCANHLSMLIADAQDERADKKNRNRRYYDD